MISLTKFKKTLVTLTAATTLIFTTSAIAGPAKPGTKMYVPGGNVVDVAIAANDAFGVFNTVIAAATCDYFEGAITDVLSGKGQRTLFAPVDSAFLELDLDADNICEAFDGSEDAAGTPEVLATILSYHVTNGREFSQKVFSKDGSMKRIEMAAGGSITTSEGKIYDNHMREVNIVAPFFDIPAKNGVIHVIDRVLLP
jgi:uncharacterized surface protein with fasciclin (FAS1) repeats